MFYSIYKTTLKNIYRSAIFWMMFVLFAMNAFQRYSIIISYDHTYGVSFLKYVQCVSNVINGEGILYYSMPLITVVSTVMVLNRDHGDNFFEIEKSAGVKPTEYVIARLAALITLNVVILTVMSYFFLHFEVFLRGGVKGIGLEEYILDSTIRMARLIVCRAIPTTFFYVCFTYCIGSVFKSSVAAAVTSIGYIVFYAVGKLMLRNRIASIFWEYLSPVPNKLTNYFHLYDCRNQREFEWSLQVVDTSLTKALICIFLLVGSGLVYSVIAYLCTRVRDK